jgi:glutamate--cysteine ligase
MTAMALPPGQPITDPRQLVEFFESGCKPAGQWCIGVEDEKFVFDRKTLRPVSYAGENGTRKVLEQLARYDGWTPVLDSGAVVAVKGADGTLVSPEGGRHIEISTAPVGTVHEVHAKAGGNLDRICSICEGLGLGLLGVGYQPKWGLDDIELMDSGRSRILRADLPTRGSLGIDMLIQTAALQVNLDFASEADMVAKFRAALALQPVVVALLAASPFKGGKPSGYQSYRSHVWTDTDPNRTGILPFVFEKGFGFERYVDYVLDVPMYFVYRDEKYINAAGQSFRDFLEGRLPAYPGEKPGIGDWINHTATVYTEARLKRYLEMRGADGGPPSRLYGLAAFWTGLLYDGAALDAASDVIRDWTAEERSRMRAEVPRTGLRTPFRNRTVLDLAREVLEISRQGLRRRARGDAGGADESTFLEPLLRIAESGRSPADEMLERYEARWGGKIEPVFAEYAC